MLKQDAIDRLKGFGLNFDGLVTAIKSEEEVDFDVPEIKKPMTEEELSSRDAVKLKEGEQLGVKKGETDAIGILAKEVTKKLGIDIKGDARIGDIVNAIQAEFTKNGDEKVKTLQTANESLNHELADVRGKVTEAERKAGEYATDRKLLTVFPKNINTSLTQDEMLLIIKNNISTEDIDGKTVVKRNGEIVKDSNTLQPHSLEKVVTDLFNEKGWVGKQRQAGDSSEGGRGGGNNPGGNGAGTGLKSRSEAVKVWLEKNPGGNKLSPECDAFVQEQAKANKDFDFYR